MNQPVHIFKKDALHLWPELLVYIGLLGALLWVAPHNHGAPDANLGWLYILLGGFIKFLIPVSWLVILSRLIHDETLVGDRQFWITRPYTWYGLLAAKLLFTLVFIYVPLLLVQAWLLHRYGLHPVLLAVPFLKNFGLLTALFVLPLFALAAVTSTFVRFALAVLAAIVYFFAVLALTAFTIPDKLAVDNLLYVHATVFVIVPVIAIVLQYARRLTAISRGLLIALPALLYVVAALTPANALVGAEFHKPLNYSAAFLPAPEYQQPGTGKLITVKSQVELLLPIVPSNLASTESLHSEHVILHITGPNGFDYKTSGWTTAFNDLQPGPGPSRFAFHIPESVYNQIKDQTVAIRVTLGVETFAPEAVYNIAATAAPFPIPSSGACTATTPTSKDADASETAIPATGTLVCTFPFANSDGMAVRADATPGPCDTASATPTATPTSSTIPMSGNIGPTPRVPAFDPIASEPVFFLAPGLRGAAASVCPGTKLGFSRMKSTGKGQFSFDIPSVVLGPYALRRQERAARRDPQALPQPQPAPQPQ